MKKVVLAWMLYQRYLDTADAATLIRAQQLAREVGEANEICPWLFRGNKSLEREWALGRGEGYFLQYCLNGAM